MKNPPAIQFYVRDWLADSHVRRMNYQERGIYLELLCYCWEDDGLPTSVDELARLCHVPLKRFERIWDRLKRQFVQVERDGETVLYNPRLLNGNGSKDKPKGDPTEASERGRKAALARWGRDEQSDAHAEGMQDAYAEPMRDASNGHAESMQDASNHNAKSDACSIASSHARYTANADADAVEDAKVNAEGVVPEGGHGGEPLRESDASRLASAFLAAREKVIKIKSAPNERVAFTDIFREILDVSSPLEVEAVIALLSDKSGKRLWRFGIGHRPDPRKPHPLLTQFGSLLAEAVDLPPGRKVEPAAASESPPIAVELPEFEPVDKKLWPNVLSILATGDPEETETWLRPLSILGRRDDELWISAPSENHAAWVRHNHADRIRAQLPGMSLRIVADGTA